MTPSMKAWVHSGTLFTLLTLALVASAWAKPEAKAGEIIVKFKATTTAAQRAAIENDLGLGQIQQLGRIHAEHGRLSRMTVDQAVAKYKNDGKIEYIEPNYVYRASDAPNDPQFTQLWGLRNTGQTGGKPGADIKAVNAWSQFKGSNDVIVAIIDTGMDYDHPDLAANAWINTGEVPNNNIDDDHNGFVDDVHGWDFANNDHDPIDDAGHGTHCSGTIGAVGNNNVGVVGVNWNVRLMPVKFLDAGGSGSSAAGAAAIDYAVMMGAKVISASWGGPGPSQALQDAITAAGQAGVLFVAAAGNAATNTDIVPNYPSAYPLDNIIAVAATDHNDQLASFSNYGVVSVDLAAPGVDILSTVPGGYGVLSGTSMATPHVAGAVALILGRFPEIPSSTAKSLLLGSVDRLNNLNGVVLSGGRLNAFLPIATPDSTSPGPITDLRTSNANGTSIRLDWTASGDDGADGTATLYELRYSTAPITAENFALATPVPQPPSPEVAGTPQSKVVQGLQFNTQYYFAIKAFDEFANPSPLSNGAVGMTLPPPDIGVTPSQLSENLLTGQQTTQTLTISNSGPSDLNFSIEVRVAGQAGSPAAVTVPARIVRTFTPTSASHAGFETPPPSYPLSARPFDDGRTPGRGPLSAGDVRVTNALAAGLKLLILQSGGNVAEIQGALALFPDISVIDIFDGTNLAPTLTDLTPYDAVLVSDNAAFGNPTAVGNALADYVDQGGGVVMTLASFIQGWDIRGRFLNEGYMPYNLGTGPAGSSALGAFDATHPIMAGVTQATGDLLGVVTLAPGAQLVASWANGLPCVATKGHVSAVNVYVGNPGFWTGDVPLILHNAALWSGGAATWLSPDPKKGVVPAGSQLGVSVTFDATDLKGGNYDALLLVDSDDPNDTLVTVPAHLHVTGAPNIALAGEEISIESVQTYAASGASTNHTLPIVVPPAGGGSIDLIADGDYGDFGETATVIAEGGVLGSAGQVGGDCMAAKGSFPLSAAKLAALTADGSVHVQVQNSAIVDAFCPTNRHIVQLKYSQPANQIDFGSALVGSHLQRRITIKNIGSDVLTVSSIVSDNPVFGLDHSSAILAPDTEDTLTVSFLPANPSTYDGVVTITSDDPDQPVLTIDLSGRGLAAPDIDVAPLSLHADLLTGQSESRTVTVRNVGEGDLDFTVEASGPGATVRIETVPPHPSPRPVDPAMITSGAADLVSLDEKGPWLTRTAPAGYRGTSTPEVRMLGAKVLIIQDAAPWGTASNEQILNGLGIAYDMIPSVMVSSANLSAYGLVIIPSDQPSSYYATLGSQLAKLDGYVTGGGVLEVHAAGWGWQGGDASLMTIPGGMHINYRTASINHVLDPAHPLMSGIPNPFSGSSASHSYFTSIPNGATLVASDDVGDPNLVVYRHGAGTVVAGCQTFEYGFANHETAGLILQNMIPFSYRPAPNWLSAAPPSGHLPPGGSAVITVTFDATGLNGGDYTGNIDVESNDPDEPRVSVACSMSVTGAPDLLVRGDAGQVESRQAYNTPQAVTLHHLAVPPGTVGGATLDVDINGDFGDFTEFVTVTADGLRLGEVGRLGSDCTAGAGSFTILPADFAAMIADGFVDVTLKNSVDVDLFCAVQQHHVKLNYAVQLSPVEFGSLFIGKCATRILQISNEGTDLLTVTDFQVAGSAFSTNRTSMSLQPGQRDTLELRFCPLAAQPYTGTLTILSNDPDHGSLVIDLHGTGLLAPDIDVAPTALHENLLTGQTRTQTLTVRNLGGSDLVLQIEATGPVAGVTLGTLPEAAVRREPVSDPPGGGALENKPVRSDSKSPAGYRGDSAPVSSMAGAKVLLVQDSSPWGTLSNQTILNNNGIAFDLISSAMFAATNLSQYRLVIIPSDQPPAYYQAMGSQIAKLEAYCFGGGVLEAHAAAWGFAGGDASLMTLPRTVHIVNSFSSTNTVLAPGHPLVAGVPSPFSGNYASHADFSNIPPDADLIVADVANVPNLIVYPVGAGLVVASGQTLEFGFANNEPAGRILANMIPWAYRPGPRWLAVDTSSATVPAGGSLAVTVTFNATGLSGGDYGGSIHLTSNDPDESDVSVPASLHVTGVPDIAVQGGSFSAVSDKSYATDGAATSHHLRLQPVGAAPAELRLDIDGDYGDFFETAKVFVEGLQLGEVGRLGSDCFPGSGTFGLTAQQFAAIAADGFADVLVQNTIDVNATCGINHHKVTLRYHGSFDPVDFGSPFVGNCVDRTVQVVNEGTDVLVVTAMNASAAVFTAAPASFSLSPGDTEDVVLRFCPAAVGQVSGTMTVVSNDPDEGNLEIHLQGTGITPPDIAMLTAPITEDLMAGQSSTHHLAIANPGGSDLTLHLKLQLPGTPVVGGPHDAATASPAPAPKLELAPIRARYSLFEGMNAGSVPVQPVIRAGRATPGTASSLGGGDVFPSMVPIFVDDFEGAGKGWTHHSAGPDSLDLWAITQVRASSGQNSWHASQHSGVGAEVLESPPISLVGYPDAILTFKHWYSFDDCENVFFEPDGGILEIREVGSATWTQIEPSGGYPYVLDFVCSNPLQGLPAYSHDGQQGDAFGTAVFDLTAYAGKAIQFRFHAGWDCGNCSANEGWYVDDVVVYSNAASWLTLSPTDLTIPAGGSTTVDLGFDATAIAAGKYEAELLVDSNDPDEPRLTIPLLLRTADVVASADAAPNTINLGSHGNFITAYVELPPGHDLGTITDVTLNDVPPAAVPPSVGDNDGDGVPDLTLKFDRALVSASLGEGDEVEVRVAGACGASDRFLAIDRVRVIRHHVTSPAAGEIVVAGTTYGIRWNLPSQWRPDRTELTYTTDGGLTWVPIATVTSGTTYAWAVPDIVAGGARVRVSLFEAGQLLAWDASDGQFQIRSSTAEVPTPGPLRPLLLQNAPNPFRAGYPTTIAYQLSAPSAVDLKIYSVAGRLVRVLVEGPSPAGRHEVTWDGRDGQGRVSEPGVYFLQMKTPTFKGARTIILLN